MRVGITGQSGFIGTHLYNNFMLQDDFECISFCDSYWDTEVILDDFVGQCDVIVHLAAMNRCDDLDLLYRTNVGLVEKLIASVRRCGTKPHILMSSSIQESLDNLYGKSKRDGRNKFIEFSKQGGCFFTGLLIPNVYGPFGKPFYNAVTSTFAYLIANDRESELNIIKDNNLDMIYVQDICDCVIENIRTKDYKEEYLLPSTGTCYVSELKALLSSFHKIYKSQSGVIPKLSSKFEISMFNTYRSYLPTNMWSGKYVKHSDDRGTFVEIMKVLGGEGQFSFSTTVPGITRGNHYHTRKVERFAVISGKASIKLRKIGSDEVIEYILDGDEPGYVDMPVWYTHNITNIGDKELITLFWINEFFDEKDPDTFYETV